MEESIRMKKGEKRVPPTICSKRRWKVRVKGGLVVTYRGKPRPVHAEGSARDGVKGERGEESKNNNGGGNVTIRHRDAGTIKGDLPDGMWKTGEKRD